VCVGWEWRLGFRCIGLHVSVTRHILGGRNQRGWRLPSVKLHLLDFFVWGLRGLEITFDSHPQPGADRSSERLVDITLHNRLTTDKCNRSHGAASELFISVWKLHYIKAFLWPSQPAQRNRNPNPLKWMAPNKLWQPCQYVNCFVVVAYAVIRTISPRIFFIFGVCGFCHLSLKLKFKWIRCLFDWLFIFLWLNCLGFKHFKPFNGNLWTLKVYGNCTWSDLETSNSGKYQCQSQCWSHY